MDDQIVALMAATAVDPRDADIVALEARLRSAQLAADVASLDALISNDLLFAGPDGSLITKADDLASHQSGAVRFLQHEPEDLRVRRVGTFAAVVSLRARLLVHVAGEPVAGTFRYTRIWASEAGSAWRVVGGHVSAV
jgi:ketosteroid isomerase-like protein